MKDALVITAFLFAACTTTSPTTTQPTPQSTVVSGPIGASSQAPTAAPPVGAPGQAGAPSATALVFVSSCRAPATPTTASTEGPYFKAGSPEKASLVAAGMPGTRIQLIGHVVTRSCAPVARAKVDVWQADANGNYDNAGYTLRGHVFTDTQGKYSIETVVPAPYPSRTPHIHVKVTPPAGATLTTQLYFPAAAGNSTDSIFRPELVMQVVSEPRPTGTFTFILDLP